MSKIYQALLRAEQERRTQVPVQDAEDVAPEPEPVHTPEITAAFTREATAIPQEQSAERRLCYGQPVQWNPVLTTLPALEDSGPAVEQLRSLRSRLLEARDKQPLKVVLVSSGMPQEGKSYVALNLAVTLARDKSCRVILIDADLRRSSLHISLGAPAFPGLVDYLSGSASAEEVMQQAESDGPNGGLLPGLAALTFIAGGSHSDNAADLVGNPRFPELIALASSHFDFVIVDSSPVNLVSDAVTLAHSCDATLLVARAGVTPYESFQRAQAELKSARILGVILNASTDVQYAGYYGYDRKKSAN